MAIYMHAHRVSKLNCGKYSVVIMVQTCNYIMAVTQNCHSKTFKKVLIVIRLCHPLFELKCTVV